MGRPDKGTGKTCSIGRLEFVLSGILSDRLNRKVTVTLEGNEKSSKDDNADCPVSAHGRRLGT